MSQRLALSLVYAVRSHKLETFEELNIDGNDQKSSKFFPKSFLSKNFGVLQMRRPPIIIERGSLGLTSLNEVRTL